MQSLGIDPGRTKEVNIFLKMAEISNRKKEIWWKTREVLWLWIGAVCGTGWAFAVSCMFRQNDVTWQLTPPWGPIHLLHLWYSWLMSFTVTIMMSKAWFFFFSVDNEGRIWPPRCHILFASGQTQDSEVFPLEHGQVLWRSSSSTVKANQPRLLMLKNVELYWTRSSNQPDGSQRRRPSTIAEQPLKAMPEPADFQVALIVMMMVTVMVIVIMMVTVMVTVTVMVMVTVMVIVMMMVTVMVTVTVMVQSLRLRTSSESERARERAEREEARPVESR